MQFPFGSFSKSIFSHFQAEGDVPFECTAHSGLITSRAREIFCLSYRVTRCNPLRVAGDNPLGWQDIISPFTQTASAAITCLDATQQRNDKTPGSVWLGLVPHPMRSARILPRLQWEEKSRRTRWVPYHLLEFDSIRPPRPGSDCPSIPGLSPGTRA